MPDRGEPEPGRATTDTRPLVTLDLFSALIDSKTGGTHFFDHLARQRGWATPGEEIYSTWDSVNKDLQRECDSWIPFRELSTRALDIAYRKFGLTGQAEADTSQLLASVTDWPTWPDVSAGLEELKRHATVGILSNVDDDIFLRTGVAATFDASNVLTSERLRSYKPSPEIYHAAVRRATNAYIHVAASARDVRGSLTAGINTIRLRRPGHAVDALGPKPVFEANSLTEIVGLLPKFL